MLISIALAPLEPFAFARTSTIKVGVLISIALAPLEPFAFARTSTIKVGVLSSIALPPLVPIAFFPTSIVRVGVVRLTGAARATPQHSAATIDAVTTTTRKEAMRGGKDFIRYPPDSRALRRQMTVSRP